MTLSHTHKKKNMHIQNTQLGRKKKKKILLPRNLFLFF